MSGSNGELHDLTKRLVDRAMAYGMEISKDKNKIMTNSTNNISADVGMNGQKLGLMGLIGTYRYSECTM